VIACLARDLEAAQHPSELFDTLVLLERRDGGAARATVRELRHPVLVVRLARNLCKMRDAKHLPALAKLAELAPDDLGDAAADAGIHLVEDHAGTRASARRGDLHRKADAGKFAASFAGDVDKEKAEFMADSQVPWGVEALSGTIREPAWKTKPSWYLIATDDKMIPPPAQQFMSKRAGSTVVEVRGSHAVYVSQPEAVAGLIEQAAKGVKLAAK